MKLVKAKNDLVLFFTEGVSLAAWDQGGMLAREVALYQRMIELGKQVEFVTYGGRNERAYTERLPGIGLRYNALNLPATAYKRSLEWLPPRGKMFKSNQVSGAQVALAAARRAGAKFIARCGYLLSFVDEQTHGEDSVQADRARKLERAVFSQADRVVVTTQAIAQRVQQQYPQRDSRVVVIPNYVEADRFKPAKAEPNRRMRIGFVGRLAWEKNIKNLVEAIKGLDVELFIVGDGPLKTELQTIAETEVTNLHILGRMNNADLPAFLNSCDLFVLPSLYEGHPKALLEAMACGLPVIGTRVPGIAELLQDGRTGLLCEPDADSLRAAVQRAMADGGLRARLGQAARDYVVNNFSLDRIVELELALLDELVSEDA